MNKFRLLNLSKNYVTKKPKMTIVIVLILAITISTFILVNQAYMNMEYVTLQSTINDFGAYHFSYQYPTYNEYDNLSEYIYVETVGLQWVIGISSIDETTIVILYNDENYNILYGNTSDIIQGREAIEEDEIVLSKGLMDSKGLEVGDRIEISYEKYDFENGNFLFSNTKTFVISGISVDVDTDEFFNVSTAFVSKEYFSQLQKDIPIESALIKLKGNSNIESQINRLSNELELKPKIKYNNELIYAYKKSDDLRWFINIINIILCISMGLVIYNVLYFNFISKNKDLGIMISLGFPPRSLARVLIYEMLIYLAICIPAGILFGWILNSILFQTILNAILLSNNDNILVSSSISAKVLLNAALLTIITVIPSVLSPFYRLLKISPLQIIRSGRQKLNLKLQWWVKFTAKFLKNKFSLYALKNLARNRKRTFVTVASIVFTVIMASSVIILNVGSEISTDWIKEFYIPGDIKIEIRNMKVSSKSNGMDEDIVESLLAIDNISTVNPYKMKDVLVCVRTDTANKQSDFYEKSIGKEIIETNTKSFEGNEYLVLNLLAIGTDIREYLDKDYIKDKNDFTIIINSEFADFLNLSIGDTIPIGFLNINESFEIGNLLHNKATIGAILDNVPIFNESGTGMSTIMADYEGLTKLTKSQGYDRFDIWLNDANDANILTQLNNIDYGYEVSIASFDMRAQQFIQNEKNKLKTQLYFIFILGLITLITCFNTIMNNVINRKDEILALNAIGITKREITKSIIIEGIWYAVFSILIIVLVQLILCIILMNTVEVVAIYCLVFLNIFIVIMCALFSLLSSNYVFKRLDINDLYQ
ncbi:MAG: FtsX-like permease family protein [Eubacteriales bacterium]